MAAYKKEFRAQVDMQQKCSVCGKWVEEGVVGHGGWFSLTGAMEMDMGHRPVRYGRRRYRLKIYEKWRSRNRAPTAEEKVRYAPLMKRAREERSGVIGEMEVIT